MKLFKCSFLLLILFFSSILLAKESKKVTIQLKWFDQFQFAGYYVAKQNGYYKELGLDVTIKPFEFGLDIPKGVSEGKFDFGVGRETLILEKSKGIDIVALYALFQSTPLVLLSTKESAISKIDHFKNKRIMTTINDASEVSLKAMIRSNNVRLDEVNFIKHSHKISDLINKNADVMSAYISKAPYELKKLGIQYNVFDPKKYGFDMYSDMLYTSNKLINEDIETVLAFKEASLKGWKYAYENINETVDLILQKYNVQKLSKEELIYEAQELKKLSYYNNEQLGAIKQEKIQRIYDLYNIMGLIENRVNFNDFVLTNKDDTIKLNSKQRAYLDNKKEITYCAIPNAMPYSGIKNGKVQGLVKDLVEALEVRLNVPFRLINTKTWPESLSYAKEKKCDILPSAQLTQSRKEYLNFTRPYIEIPTIITTKNDIPFLNNLDGLRDVRIGISKGYSSYEILKKKYKDIEFVPVDSMEEGFDRVKNAELYGQISSMGRAWSALQGKYSTSLKISGKLDEKIDIRMGIRNDDLILLEILDEAVSKISKDDVDRINNKWIYIEHKKAYDYTLLIQALVVIFVVVMILLYRQNLLNKMNKKLNKKVEEKTEELQKINNTLEQRIKDEVEKNLKKDRMLAQQSKMAAMGRMIENIAHQWRQPLSVISTGASGLKLKKQVDDLDDTFFFKTMDSIIDSSKYLSHTIDDFRYFFKPDNEKTTFDVSHVLQKTINLLKSKFDHEEIQIITKLEVIEVYGHETELIQVFMNILTNAKDALEASNEKEKYIFVKVKKEKESILVEFKDNAGGIKNKVIDKIFEPYFTTKHSSKGTGIGLYMCDQIVSKYMSGKIEVRNKKFTHKKKEYKGASFTVVFEQKLQSN